MERLHFLKKISRNLVQANFGFLISWVPKDYSDLPTMEICFKGINVGSFV